jgi:8-oxo-dGTP pyrophosphatase MutT (NUDIX family)
VNSGEEYDGAMSREIPEEIGVPSTTCRELARLKYFPACTETDQEFVWLYRAIHSGPFTPDPQEVAGLTFFSPQEIDQLIIRQPQDFSTCLLFLWQKHHP